VQPNTVKRVIFYVTRTFVNVEILFQILERSALLFNAAVIMVFPFLFSVFGYSPITEESRLNSLSLLWTRSRP
jgi:hypothetical protein